MESTCNSKCANPGRCRRFSASSASAAKSPAATICPAPLSFAATKFSPANTDKTSVRSPPRTADIPAGDAVATLAISTPRERTKERASLLLIAPESAAAANSPTECPDVTAKLLTPKACAPKSDVATIKG